MTRPSRYLKLPFSFDLARLQHELGLVESSDWVSHFNTQAYEKNWACIPLRSVDGRMDHIMPVESSSFQDTPILARCPYLREVIDSFQCEKTSVRLMAMDPGAVIKEHRDDGTSLEDGITRLHIPIQTAPEVLFRIEGEEVHFSAGDAWYLNASCLHAVENRSPRPRVHLMLDCISNAWLEDVFQAAGWVPRENARFPERAEDKALKRGRKVDRAGLASLAHWLPVALDDGAETVWWRHIGDKRLTEPFFADSLQSQSASERLVCQTPLSALDEVADSVQPTAFIFHVSRCGSTLLTQMLATLPQCIVVSEPPVLDAFFRLLHRQPGLPGADEIFKKLVAALGQRRRGDEQQLFVKLDSWHTPWMPWLRKVYPDTPFVFLYRDPAQVLASHRRQRGPQMVPGLLDTSLLQPDVTGLAPADLEGYGARVQDAVFKAALAAQTSAEQPVGAELVNYAQLPRVLWTRLFPLFSMQCNEEALMAVQARSHFHSKHGAQKYEGDPAPGGAESPAVQAASITLAQGCYEQLEKLRTHP